MIRPVTAHELPILHALIESAYRGDSARRGWTHEADLLGGQRTDLAALRAIFDDPRQCLLVLPGTDGLLGCIQIAAKREAVAYLGMLAVDPARQADGIGGRLLDAAERTAVEHFSAISIEMLVINQRPALIAWYERRGYRLTGREEPFPLDDERLGLPTRRDFAFVVLEKRLAVDDERHTPASAMTTPHQRS